MSTNAARYRRTLPTRQELREEINYKEVMSDTRAIQKWSEYLMETGRIYQ